MDQRSASRSQNPQSGLPPFHPPRNLREALEAARELAEAEVLHYLPSGTPVADRNKVDPYSSLLETAQTVASRVLSEFLLLDEADQVAEGIAEAAIDRRIRALIATGAELSDVTAMRGIPDAAVPLARETGRSCAPLQDEDQQDEQFESLIKALWEAFSSSCELYGYLDLPEGVSFEDLPLEQHDRCVRRGRYDAFSQFEPLLTWDAAAHMAELIAEAAWQFQARELATPPSAFNTKRRCQ